MSCFKNSFTIFVFDAAVWTGGTASMIPVYSLPGLIATFTGVLLSMTLVSTPEPIIRSTFFCLSYPDQSCTNHKGQENCENFHLDDFFNKIECSKLQILSSEKILYKSLWKRNDSVMKLAKKVVWVLVLFPLWKEIILKSV